MQYLRKYERDDIRFVSDKIRQNGLLTAKLRSKVDVEAGWFNGIASRENGSSKTDCRIQILQPAHSRPA
jgi:hypothetical protein